MGAPAGITDGHRYGVSTDGGATVSASSPAPAAILLRFPSPGACGAGCWVGNRAWRQSVSRTRSAAPAPARQHIRHQVARPVQRHEMRQLEGCRHGTSSSRCWKASTPISHSSGRAGTRRAATAASAPCSSACHGAVRSHPRPACRCGLRPPPGAASPAGQPRFTPAPCGAPGSLTGSAAPPSAGALAASSATRR